MKVVFTGEARRDLADIGDSIAVDSPNRARSFVRELTLKARQLAEMPRAFPLVPRYETSGVRRRPFGNYLIFYRAEKDQITIVHIMHGARDYERLLFPDP